MNISSRIGLTACFMSCIGLTASAYAGELLTNGGFESGDFTGWSANTEPGSDGSLLVQSGTGTPHSGMTTVGPASGSFFALTDQSGPGAYALTQTFSVDPGASSVLVSFDLFANNYAGSTIPGTLDYTSGPRQFATADLLTGTANPFSTAGGDVLENFYQGSDTGTNPNPYTHYSFDVTGLTGAGGTFQIRFGEADNQLFFDLGVDNVSVSEVAGTPEPATFLLMLPLLGGLAFKAVRRPARNS